MRHILAVFFCLILLLASVLFKTVSVDDMLNCYSHAVEIMGKSQLTSAFHMIGERHDEKDDYTGSYTCDADDAVGRDVVYGGCSIDSLSIRLEGRIRAEHGLAAIRIRQGNETMEIDVDENGFFDEQLVFDSGGNYIMVDYKHFTGEVELNTAYE